MTRTHRRKTGLMAVMVLMAVVSACGLPEGAVPVMEPLLFCKKAQAGLFESREKPTEILFGEMYSKVSSLGLELSEKLKNNKGHRVAMTGFMAPPLKPTINFFVLTREPMSICPFCSSDADWPIDIVLVKLDRPVVSLPFDRPIRVTGLLELGTEVDAETGFVSLVRIKAEELEEI